MSEKKNVAAQALVNIRWEKTPEEKRKAIMKEVRKHRKGLKIVVGVDAAVSEHSIIKGRKVNKKHGIRNKG